MISRCRLCGGEIIRVVIGGDLEVLDGNEIYDSPNPRYTITNYGTDPWEAAPVAPGPGRTGHPLHEGVCSQRGGGADANR